MGYSIYNSKNNNGTNNKIVGTLIIQWNEKCNTGRRGLWIAQQMQTNVKIGQIFRLKKFDEFYLALAESSTRHN